MVDVVLRRSGDNMSGDRAEGAGTGESREGEEPSLDSAIYADAAYAEESEEAGVPEVTNIPHVMRVTRPV